MVAADHLEVPRNHGLFHHHGIDLGDGTIAHYLEGRQIIQSSLEYFSGGAKCSVVIHKNASSSELTLKRAKSRIGEQNYNLLFNNCEHFANWCKTGLHRSKQLEDLFTKSSLKGIQIDQLLPPTFFSGLKVLLRDSVEHRVSKKQISNKLLELKELRKLLMLKLESTLDQLNNWLNSQAKGNKINVRIHTKHPLVLTGQKIADQLTAIENLEEQINVFLKESSKTSK